ncbi:hypothetical protein MKFW12EY_16250 [Methylomonas koyamae]|nr:hypothetical protein MKFW12EY_16250 [Methylomonas koyamae]
MALSVLCIGLCGCSSLYFHSDGDQKLIDEAQKGFAAAKTAQIAALDTRSGLVATEIARQRQAVIEDQLALRDNQIALLLDSKDAQNEVRNNLVMRMEGIVGKNNVNVVFKDKKNIRVALNTREKMHQHVQASRENVLLNAIKENISIPKDDVEGYCNQSQGSIDSKLSTWCDIFNDDVQNYETQVQKLESSDPVVFAKGAQGELGTVSNLLLQATNVAKAQEKVIKSTKASLEDAKSYYECQLEADKKSGIDDNLQKAAAVITRFANPTGQKADPASGNAPATAQNASNCPQADSLWKTAFENNGLTPEVVNLINKVAPQILAATMEHTQAKFTQSVLGRSIMAVADSQAQTQDTSAQADTRAANKTKTEVIAVETVKLLGYIEDYENAAEGKLPDIPVALIGLSRAQLASDLASIALTRFEREKELLTAQRIGLLNEIDLLKKANETLIAKHTNRAILLRGDAWSNGELPARVAEWDRKNLLYEDWAAQQRAIAKANYETLEPMVSLLQEYGAGGVSGKDIANWVGALAAVAIAFGVN